MKSAADRLAQIARGLALPFAVGPLVLASGAQTAIAREADVVAPPTGPAADYPMVLGAPFVISGVTYTPVDTLNYDAVGYAVADGEGGGGITAAHRTLPLPCYVEVTALDTGRTILVRLERRGPMTGDGLVALSPGAMAQLGLTGSHVPVRVRRVNPPEPERAALRTGQQAPARMDTPPGLLAALKRKMGILPPADPSPESLAAALAASRTGPVPPPMAKPVAPKPEVRNTTPLPAPRPPAAPAPKPAATPPRKVEAPKEAPKPSATRGYVVQVGAFSTRANADKAAAQVGGRVEQAGKFFRVQIGPSASEADAKAALAKAKRSGYADARVQRAP